MKKEEADGPHPIKTTAPKPKHYEWTSPTTGKTHKIPKGIDPGWDYNPGKAAWDEHLGLTSFEKMVQYRGTGKKGLKDQIDSLSKIKKSKSGKDVGINYALTAAKDIKGKSFAGNVFVNEVTNQAAAISWIPQKDALKLVTLGSNVKNGGTEMIKQAVKVSMAAGYKGRLTLVSVRNMHTLKFYYEKCGFTELKGGGLFELELTQQAAEKFMARF